MDRSKLGKTAWVISIIYYVISIAAVVLEDIYSSMFKTNRSMAQHYFDIGFKLSGVSLLLYPLIGGTIFIIISLIGLIKNKKVFPYLLCSIISIILWILVLVTYVRYI